MRRTKSGRAARRRVGSGRVGGGRLGSGRVGGGRAAPRHGAVAVVVVLVAIVVAGAFATAVAVAGGSAAGAATGDGTQRAIGTGGGGSTRWTWPTPGRDVLEPWGDPPDEYAAGHRGIDIAAAIGEPVVAPDDGTVSFAGPVAGRSVVVIDHGGALRSTLDAVDPAVRVGDVVRRGQTVAAVAGGHCSGPTPCLHLGARIDGRYVDPMPFLQALPWPVLLPDSAWPAA